MATQEEFIQALISRLQPQGTPAAPTQFDQPENLPPTQFAAQPFSIGQPQAGSLAAGFVQDQAPAQPLMPPPTPEEQERLNIFGAADRAFLPPPQPASDESQNYFMQVGRGLGRGFAQSGLTLGQGLFATADAVTNVAGYEDAIDPETSEFLKGLNEAREIVGYEEGAVGKMAEVIGSMGTLIIPGLGIARLGAGAAAAQAAGRVEAARRLKNFGYGLRGLTGVVASGTGAGTANQMLEAYAKAGNEVTNAQRNLSTAFGLGIGLTELLPLEILLRGIPASLGRNVTNRYAVRAAQNITNAGAEGGQEAVAGIMQELAAQGNYNPDQPIGESALSDFGYGSAAGSIIDALLGKKLRLPKTEKALSEDYQKTEALQPLTEEELSEIQRKEEDIAYYDDEGNQQGGQVVGFDDDTVTLSVDDDLITLPRNQMPDPDTGNSFASDADLLTPRFKIDGEEIGAMTLPDVVDLRNKELLPDTLRAEVDAGNISLEKAIEMAKTDDQQLVANVTPDKKYRIKALTQEINRRDPEFNASLSEEAADQQSRAAAGVDIDSGEFGDDLDASLNARVSPSLTDTVVGRTVGGTVDPLVVGEDALKKAMKGVSKKDRATYYKEVGASPDAAFGDLNQGQVVDLLERASGHKERKAAEKKAQEEREAQAATEEQIQLKAQEIEAAKQQTVVTPTTGDQATVVAEEIAETIEEAPAQPALTEKQQTRAAKFRKRLADAETPIDRINAAVSMITRGQTDNNPELIAEGEAALRAAEAEGFTIQEGTRKGDTRTYNEDTNAGLTRRVSRQNTPNDGDIETIESVQKVGIIKDGRLVQVSQATTSYKSPQPEETQITPEPEVVVEEAPAPVGFQSKTVEDSKPRYRNVTPVFNSLLDKALYIVGNPKSKSKADEQVMGELRSFLQQKAPDLEDANIRRLGMAVRDNVKYQGEIARKAERSSFEVQEQVLPDVDLSSPDLIESILDRYQKPAADTEPTAPKPVKPTLPKTEQVVATPKEKADLREAIGVMAGDNAKAIKLGTEAYQRRRDQGESHEEALDAFAQDPDFQDAALDFARREQGAEQVSPGPVVGIAGTQTAPGVPGMLVQKQGPPIDINTIRRIRKIVNDVAPTSDLVVASQLYGQVVDRDGDVQYVINGNEVNYEQALGLQMGNIVGVSVAPDAVIDPENRAYHEATHFLVNNGFITEPEMRSLIANIPRLEQIVLEHLGQKRYKEAMSGNEFQKFNELIAYGSALYNRGLDIDGKVPKEFNPALRRIFAKIARLFKQLRSNFTGEFVPMEVEQVFEQIRQGRTGRRAPDPQATQRVKQAMLKEDPTGLSAATPLFVIKQGPVAASSSFENFRGEVPARPAFKSAMKTKLEGMTGQKKLPDAWGRVEGNRVVGALSGVKVEEWNDSNIEAFLTSLPPDKSVSGQELLDYFNDIEQVVEIVVYGSPLGPKNDSDSEIKYRSAIQEDRNNQGYIATANDAMTSLRTGKGKDVVNAMQVANLTRKEVPNKDDINPAYPPDVVDALESYAEALKKQDASFDDLPDPIQEKQRLITALQKSFKRDGTSLDQKAFGLTLVEASVKPGFQFTREAGEMLPAGFSMDDGDLPLQRGAGTGSAYGTEISDIPNFYFAWTTMGGRAISAGSPRSGMNLQQDYGYREIIIAAPSMAGDGTYHSHFPDIRNPIMHMRLADIILENGESVLVIEEIQSDVHQGAAELMKRMAAKKLFEDGAISDSRFKFLNRDQKNLVREAASQFKDDVYGKVFPNLPLKNENQRIAFAMQQITRMAINGGYDHIAVSNSELQVERYKDEYKAAIDGLVMTQVADVGVDSDAFGVLAGQENVFVVNTEQGTFEVSETDVRMELESLIEQDILAPAFPDPFTGSFPTQEQLTGEVAPQEIQRDQEAIDQAKENSEDSARKSVAQILAFAAQRGNLSGFRAASARAADAALQETVDVDGLDAIKLAFMKALLKANPDMPSSWLATYTTPVVGMNNQGQTVRGNFQRQTIELGNQGVTRSGNPRLDDWLGEDVALLVRNDLQNPETVSDQFASRNFVQFIQNKIAQSQTQKERLNAGDNELTSYQRSEAELMDVDSIQRSVNRFTGAIDVPVGGGFDNVYDEKIPRALESALASLISTSKSQLKSKRRSVRQDNEGQRLYLGSGHSLAADIDEQGSQISAELSDEILIEESQIVSADQVQSMPQRARYVGDEFTTEGQALAQAIGEDPSMLQLVGEQAQVDPDTPDLAVEAEDVSQRFMIPVSNSRNALRVYTLTPEMEASPKVLQPSDIYFAKLQNERAEVTNHGTEQLRGVAKNARQKAVDYINGMPFFNTLKGLPQKREFYLERAKYLGVVQASSEIGTVLRDEIGNQFLFRKGDKNRGATETLRTSIFNYMTTGDASQEQALLEQLEALDPRAAKASAKAKDMIESLGLQMVQNGLMAPKTFYENRRSYLPRIYLKHLLQDPNPERFGYLKRRNEELTPEDQEALGVINELDPAFLVSQAIQRPIRDLQFIEFMNSIAGNNAWTVEDDVLMVKYTDVNGNEQEQSGLYLLDQVATLRQIADAVEAADPNKAATLRRQAEELDQTVIKTFTERDIMEYYNEPNRDVTGDTQGYGAAFKRVPRGKQYGMLSGRLVRSEIYDNVISSGFMLNLGDQSYVNIGSKGRKLTAIWKTIKVPLNPPTIARNTFSNAILIHLSGVPFYRVLPRMIEATREIVAYNNGDFANAKHYQEMLARGVKQSSFTDQELVAMQDDMLDFLKSVDAKDLGLFGWLKLNTWQRLAQKASNIYQGIEVVGKTAIAIDVMDRQGGSADDAFLRAQEYLFDYGDVPDVVRGLRQSPLGIPFLTFQYKVLPVLAKTALRNPMRFAPYVALSYALPALFMNAFDIDDDDYDEIKASMPDYIRGNPGLIPLPARDAEGRLQFLDTSYLYPWGSFTNLINGAFVSGKKAVGVGTPLEQGIQLKDISSTLGMFGGPGWSLYDISQNRDSFTDRPIVNPTDPLYIKEAIERPFYNRGKITDAMFWAANQYLLPGFLNTEYGAVSKINTALKGDSKPNGVAPDTLNQSMFRMLGLNAITLDPDQIRLSLQYLDREESQIKTGINRLKRDKTLSRPEKNRRINAHFQTLERYRLQRKAIIEAAATTNRVTNKLRIRDERKAREGNRP